MQVDYLAVEESVRAGYRLVIEQYRRDDELEVQTENHERLTKVLQSLCRSFARPITALDVGCGTGRYFHCLESVDRLVGIDISEEMLSAARHPVREQSISVGRIELLRANIHLVSLPAGSFDLIYSLGMFGHGCPVTAEVCDKLYSWLKPGGRLLFNVVDIDGLPLPFRVRQRVRGWVYPRLPHRVRLGLQRRQTGSPFFGMTRRQLIGRMQASRFKHFTVVSQPCRSPLWSGRHLECLAARTTA